MQLKERSRKEKGRRLEMSKPKTFSEGISVSRRPGGARSQTRVQAFSENIATGQKDRRRTPDKFLELTPGLRNQIENFVITHILQIRPFRLLPASRTRVNLSVTERRAFQEARFKALVQELAKLVPEAETPHDYQVKIRQVEDAWLFENPKENFKGAKPAENRLW